MIVQSFHVREWIILTKVVEDVFSIGVLSFNFSLDLFFIISGEVIKAKRFFERGHVNPPIAVDDAFVEDSMDVVGRGVRCSIISHCCE